MSNNESILESSKREKILTIKQRFRNAIKRGTGETHLIIKDNPGIDFSNDIIKAALKNLSYDNQSEGRASYVFELIELSNKKEKIRKAILEALATERTDSGALEQLFDIAALFAKKGDKEARKAIYKRFYKKTIQGSEHVGEDAIVEIDGLEGLKYIAEVKGKAIQKDPKEWDDSWLVDGFQEQNPEIKVYKELEKSSRINPYIKTYLDAIKEHKVEFQKIKRPKYNYKIISEGINNNVTVPITYPIAKRLSKSDIIKLADDFLKETDRNKLEKYIRVFDKVKYPYDHKPILNLAKSKNKRTDRLVEFATGALKYFSSAEIRDVAIKKLKEIRVPCDHLDLLVANYKKGDSKLLTDIVNRCKDEHEIHSIVYGIINIYKTNKTRECKEPLEAVYDRLTCGIHRTDIKILIDNKLLSDRLKNEIKFDSSEETRELYKKLFKKRKNA